MAGEDATMPTAFALGDVHRPTSGSSPAPTYVPIFGDNAVDEAYYARSPGT